MQIVIGPNGIELEYGEKRRITTREKGNSLVIIPDNYTVIDVETTGLDPQFDEIIEIAALKIKNGTIVDKFESLVKPNGYYTDLDDDNNEITYYVDEFITNLTGITNDMLETAPLIINVLPKFTDFIGDDVLIGHNVNFDINFLYDVLLSNFNYKLQNDFVDLMRLARKVYPEFTNHKLKTIAENLKVYIERQHRSLADCDITYKCFLELSKYIYDKGIDLSSLFSKQRKGYKDLDLRDIKADTTDFSQDHPLYNKYCTFTGKLEKMQRKDAAQIVVNLGGKCLNSVTKETNYLILGNFEYNTTVKDGKSSKLKKAEKLILEGQDLQILSENVFYDLVNNE